MCALTRLKQCLSVFFEHYPSVSANHKASNTLRLEFIANLPYIRK